MTKTRAVWWKLCVFGVGLRDDCSGQDLIEYALMAGFIVCGVVTLAPQIAEGFVTVMSKANSVVVMAGSS